MKPPEAIQELQRQCCVPNSKFQKPRYQARALGIHALRRLLTMRSYNIGQALLPLPGENPIPDLAPSADRKQRLRESPLGRKPRN